MKKPDISGVGSYERNYDGKSSSVVVVCPLQRIVYDQMEEASSELTVAYAYGLSFGGYRERQISTRICVSRERFGEAIFFVDEKKKQPHCFTRVCWFASNKVWRVDFRVQLFVASEYRLRSNGRKKKIVK